SDYAKVADLDVYVESSDLSTVATSGSYNDLTDKPSIPSTVAALSDASDYAKKAELPDMDIYVESSDLSPVATSGSYNDLTDTPTIPSTVAELTDAADYANVQADWNESDDTKDSYIQNKPVIPTTVAELSDAADYVTKAEYDELKSSYEKQLLGMCAEMNPNKIYKGAFLSKFSVSADRQVVFSQGNLQYQPSTQTWRFAEHQYDAVGGVDKKGVVGGTVYESSVKCSNQNANNSSYTGWIDLFCYGTSGWNSGAAKYNPTDYSESAADYCSESLTGDYKNADWGVFNAIINGGNKAGMWRTLTGAEWNYVVRERPNASQLFAMATIDIEETPEGVSKIYGFILLPDDWTTPAGCTFTPANLTASATLGIYTSTNGFPANVYTKSQWADMQAAGAVFFPSSGITKLKSGVFQQTNVGPKIYAAYWSSTKNWLSVDETTAGSAWQVETQNYSQATGLCVRLVRDVE
ncbi:MAG: hypothetical protein MJ198_04960, partial [Bacteroidales bacterium]|nr:hypothetical protein [Bacteroidales bacterium]